jgi:hypothetical protein
MTYTPRRLRLFPMYSTKYLLQLSLKLLILGSLIKFTHKMSARPQGLLRKLQSCCTQILNHQILEMKSKAANVRLNIPYFQRDL